ncbi:MAG: glycosyltransferase family 4 protein [Candidatus Carbobacillus altaicus]|nr:glycosyltransferase family 4 protein [Candidatus Carbobacillus altaicus]
MHIGILAPITHRIPPRAYGPWERVASQLAEGLVARGMNVTLFATQDAVTSARLSAVVPGALSEHPEMPPRAWEQMHIGEALRRARELKVDLLHNHLNFWPLPFSALVPYPILTTLHGAAMLEDEARLVFRRYSHLPYVSISRAEAAHVPELNYVANVHNGIPVESFPFYETCGEALVFLGRVSYEKGTDLAIELAQTIKRRLIIAGPVADKDRAFFKEKIEPHLDGASVEYRGVVDHIGRDKLFKEAYALVHPIRFPEPFGLVLIEAMATGTPVLGLDRGAVSEVVGDGVGGFVGAHLEELIDKARALPSLSRAAIRRRVEENFSLKTMVEGYVQAYLKVLERSSE